ncbi:MAG: glycoside hydrolase TIM-barrel-like domain-containing protein [Alphaproteobacteria bacterium]|nr:glycoside hydrolase TIM-barrel-like domain-containing protein [Alphaproteobacteria bacterium]OJV14111.1 MAG: hypothetical protein BGO27_01325 [Alphaproteobacteria bacterium 33-17]
MASIVLASAATAYLSSYGAVAVTAGTIAATMAGGAIDDRMFGLNKIKQKTIGHKLSDLYVQSSAYASIIPEIFGTVKIAGNIIWAMPLKECEEHRVHSSRVGKGGGKKVSNHETVFVYYATIAIALCKGEINEITKIWADCNQLDPKSINYRVYSGTDTQLPDPVIEAYEGIGKAPAYRGLSYVVIENFPLFEYGNRIPNFSFEVVKKPKIKLSSHKTLEEKIEAITIIPGSGECVYDTEPQFKVFGKYHNGKFLQKGKQLPINTNNREFVTDASLSLKQLNQALPNLKWVSIAVCWFGNSLNIQDLLLKPGVEYKDAETLPSKWNSGKYDRNLAHLISKDKDGFIRFGGTPSDSSLHRFIDKCREMGYKIMLYPMIMLDLEGKPWRGHITGSYKDVNNFFDKEHGYNDFIMHYAKTFGDKVDCLAIGSELKNITSIQENNHYIAVDNLISLAKNAKSFCKTLTYAADWSEYHHDNIGNYNLDALWASEYIDVVGIDAYFPLTNDENQDVKKGWESGECYDEYEAPYALKNIRYWWENYHYNNGQKTAWQPKMKKIWFTEYGFPSVDKAANQPNVFYDPESSDGGFPKGSNGSIDFEAQYNAINQSLDKFTEFEFLENSFLWCWDTRPYPYWPQLKHLWRDHNLWKTGHWINGKIGRASLSNIVSELMLKAGFLPNEFDASQLHGEIDGLIINEDASIIDVLQTLSLAYFFCIINDNIIRFIPFNDAKTYEINSNDLLVNDKNQYIEIEKASVNNLDTEVNVVYISRNFDYQQMISSKRRSELNNYSKTIAMPLVLSDNMAEKIAEYSLYNDYIKQISFSFSLTNNFDINIGDIIKLDNHIIKVTDITYNIDYTTYIKGHSTYSVANINHETIGTNIKTSGQILSKNYISHIFELPNYFAKDKSKLNLYFACCSETNSFAGVGVFDSGNFKEYGFSNLEACIGNITKSLHKNSPYFEDKITNIHVSIISGDIYQTDSYQFALIGDEVIAFKNVQTLETNEYILSDIIRVFAQDHSFLEPHEIGDRFILLDESILSVDADINLINKEINIIVSPIGEDISTGDKISYQISGQNLKPLSPIVIGNQIISGGLLPYEIKDFFSSDTSSQFLLITDASEIVISDAKIPQNIQINKIAELDKLSGKGYELNIR